MVLVLETRKMIEKLVKNLMIRMTSFEQETMDGGGHDLSPFWEGTMLKKGKNVVTNKQFKERWVVISAENGGKFQYFEDHTKTKALGVVPLEMSSWCFLEASNAGSHNSFGTIEIKTVGREAKAEGSGRTFFFRFLADNDRDSFFAALARATYLRNRALFLVACANGDAFTVFTILEKMGQQQLQHIKQQLSASSTTSSQEKRKTHQQIARELYGASNVTENQGAIRNIFEGMRVQRPVAFCADYDVEEIAAETLRLHGKDEKILAEAAALGCPGVVAPTPLDLLLRETDEEGNSCLHLAVRSIEKAPWSHTSLGSGNSKNAVATTSVQTDDSAVEANIVNSGNRKVTNSANGPKSLIPLRGSGPHPIATLRVLLYPPALKTTETDKSTMGGDSEAETYIELLGTTIGASERNDNIDLASGRIDLIVATTTSGFLLECVTNNGETALHLALNTAPFRTDGSDAAAISSHSQRQKKRDGGNIEDQLSMSEQPTFGEDLVAAVTEVGLASLHHEESDGNNSWNFGHGGLAIAQLLLVAGSRPSCANDRGMNALHIAAAAGEEFAPILIGLQELSGGADVDMPDRSGAVPLMHAARMSNGLGLEILLALGADLHATNEENGYTGLSYAVRHAASLSTKILLREEKKRRIAAHSQVDTSNKAVNNKHAKQIAIANGEEDGENWIDGFVYNTLGYENPTNAPSIVDSGFEEEELVRPGGSTLYYPHPSLVARPDSRGDLALHLLARAYVAKSREGFRSSNGRGVLPSFQNGPVLSVENTNFNQQRIRSIDLQRYTDILAMLLDAMACGADGKQHKTTDAMLGEAVDGEASSTPDDGILNPFRRPVGRIDALGHDKRTALLILSRAEPEEAYLDMMMQTFDLLLVRHQQGREYQLYSFIPAFVFHFSEAANVHTTTPGGHTAVHLAGDVGNYKLVGRLVSDLHADPNAQSADGYTAFGYVKRRLRTFTSNQSLRTRRLLTKTSDALLQSGAYRVERSERALEQDSTTAQWMKSETDKIALRAGTAPRTVAYLCRPTTPRLDIDAFCWQFHRVLHDDKDELIAVSRFLRLLRDVYEGAESEAAETAAAARLAAAAAASSASELGSSRSQNNRNERTTGNNPSTSTLGIKSTPQSTNTATTIVSIHRGVWQVFDRLIALRPELLPSYEHPKHNMPANRNMEDTNGMGNVMQPTDSSESIKDDDTERRAGVRSAMRDLVASTVRSGLPDALCLSHGHSSAPELPAAYRYAKKGADAGDSVWTAFLSRSPLVKFDDPSEESPKPDEIQKNNKLPLLLFRSKLYCNLANTLKRVFPLPGTDDGGKYKPGTEAKDNQANENGNQKAISHQGAHEYKGILAFSPQQIGTHITLLVHAAFCEINLRELLDKRLERGAKEAPGFSLLKTLNKRLSWVLTSEILLRDALKERARVVELLVRSAEVVMRMNNYDSTMTIVGILEQAPIYRLKKTWNEVNQLIPLHWAAVRRAAGTGGNSLSKTMLELAVDPPCMLYGGYILNELMKNNEASDFIVKEDNPTDHGAERNTSWSIPQVKDHKNQSSAPLPLPPSAPPPPPLPPPPPPPALVNFDRMRRISVVVDAARSSQSREYPFTMDDLDSDLLQILLEEPFYTDDDTAYDRSLKLEAQANKKRAK